MNYLTTNEISEVWLLADTINELVDSVNNGFEHIHLDAIELFDINGEGVGFLVPQPNAPKTLVYSSTRVIDGE